jgi:hypothetical protein
MSRLDFAPEKVCCYYYASQKGQTTKSIGNRVVFALNVLKSWAVFFDEEMAAKDTLCLKILKSQIFVICIDGKFGTAKQHCAIFAESLKNAE